MYEGNKLITYRRWYRLKLNVTHIFSLIIITWNVSYIIIYFIWIMKTADYNILGILLLIFIFIKCSYRTIQY